MVEQVIAGKQWQRADWIAVILLFVGLSSLYFATTSGITSSNDGSHYALARTMVANRTFALKQFDDYAEGNDIAVREGVLYSDRPPGTAVFSALFYSLADFLPAPRSLLPSRHDADNPHLAYVLLLPVWAGAGTAVLLYGLLRRQGVTRPSAVTAVLMFGLGTIQWKYSTVLFSHALSGFLVLLAVWLARGLVTDRDPHWRRYGWLGLVLGVAVLVEYANALLVLLVGLFVVAGGRPFTPRRLLVTTAAFVGGGIIPALFLSYYNTVNFGSPFTLSYAYAINYPWAGDFRATFSTPLPDGLRAMLIWGQAGGWCNPTCFNQGLFLLSPVMLLALPGFVFYFRRARRDFFLTTTIFLVYLLLFSKHFTLHGFTGDGRYLAPFLSLLALPLAHCLDWLFTPPRQPGRQTAAYLVVYSLFFLSLRNQFYHVGFSYNYNLDLSRLDQLIASPQNWQYLSSQVFRNTANLPLLWLAETAVFLLLAGGRILTRSRS